MKTSISPALLRLKARFETWRRTRASIRTRTPEHLRQAALALLDQHPASLICRVCRIHPRTLQAPRVPKKRTNSTPAFFPLPPLSPALQDMIPSHSQTETLYRVVIERSDGAKLTICLPSFDQTSLSAFCADFLRSC
jgi:hypothetical protein